MQLPCRLALTLLIIILFCFVSTAQAQKQKKKLPAAPKPSQSKVDVIVQNQELDSPGRIAVQVSDNITKVRIVSESRDFSVSRDTTAKKSFVVDVDLEQGNNKFNVIGYSDSAIVYSSPAPVIVGNSLEATPVKKKDKPVTAEETPETDGKKDPKKIRFTKSVAESKKSAYELSVNLDDLTATPDCNTKSVKKCEFRYVVKVSQGANSRLVEVPILTIDAGTKAERPLAAKNETPKPDQKINIELFDGDNTVTVVAKYQDKIEVTQSDEFQINCKNCDTTAKPDDPKKISLKNPLTVSKQSTYRLKVNLSDIPDTDEACKAQDATCKYQYEVTVTSEGKEKKSERTWRVPILNRKDKNLTSSTVNIKEDQVIIVGLQEGKNTISVVAKQNDKPIAGTQSDKITVECEDCTDSGSSVNTRAIVGFEQIGGSSTDSEQHPFVDFFFNAPFHVSFGKKKSPFSIWGNVRFSNIPVQDLASFATFNPVTAVGFIGGTDTSSSNKLTPTFDMLIGLDKPLFSENDISMGFLPGRSAISLIAGVGVINPLSVDKTTRIFKVPKITGGDVLPAFLKMYPEADPDITVAGTPIDNIAFVPIDREKFYRQYYAGIRIRTFFYDDNDINKPKNLFPALVDISFGQNEAITNVLRGVILKFDGSAPLPIKGNNFLYLFGGLQLKLGQYKTKAPPGFFTLDQADPASATNTNTIFVTSDRAPGFQRNRDTFRIGIGIDLFRIFKQTSEQ